jgi:uncharacterized protein (DUF1800 family)
VPTAARAPAAVRAAAELGASPRTSLADARHLLNRCAFGPKPGQVEAVAQLGASRWLDAQLAGPTESPLLTAALEPNAEAYAPPAELVSNWLGDDWRDDTKDLQALREKAKPHYDEHLKRLATAELTRHILSQRQLEEVMVDFWVNHFNVYAAKGFVRLFEGDYIERAIRPNALGHFRDLLLATARHPAMLIYLDNAESRKADAAPMNAAATPAGKPRGLNENYARELLELHTLGVDGGYTQTDVTNVARVLTGWSVVRMQSGRFEYEFKHGAHDKTEKTVLGTVFPAGRGEREGVELLELLAKQPATAHHLAQKLCARFVADVAPPSCVQAAMEAYLTSDGDIRTVLKAIFSDASFWSESAQDNKLKTPVELVASAARAFGAVPDGSIALADTLRKLGEPLLQESLPTGYPEGEPEWSSGGGMLARMTFATELGSGKVPGLRVELGATLRQDVTPAELAARLNQVLFDGRESVTAARVAAEVLPGIADPAAREAAAVALFVGGPDFQRQ